MSGAVYFFTLDGTWKERAFLKPRIVHPNLRFGISVALDGAGSTLAVGADWDPSSASGIDGDDADSSANSAGAAYVFR
ncbi:MAG: hypothetical protein JNL38_00695 [Myxococcales bacterium]|nr:hypothetical protein [Myxococcales bacterium]